MASRGRVGLRAVSLPVAIALVAIAGYLVSSPAMLDASGTPRLVVDRTVIDFGDVTYGKVVTAQFTLRNAGNSVLTITEAPIVKALKGC